jgi:flagellar hook-associated protein 1 FlgK
MAGIYGVLNIGKTSLLTQQTAIEVTSHNIANVNTEGYTRQVAAIETGNVVQGAAGLMGTGSRIGQIQRSYDSFLGAQINTESGRLGKWQVKEESLRRVEISFNDSMGFGLSKAISDFFNEWQNLSVSPESESSRQALLGKGYILSESFKKASSDINQLIKDIDDSFQSKIGQVNEIVSNLANLGTNIQESEISNNNANDLRDSRDLKVKDLAKLLDVTINDTNDDQATISTGSGGRPLVISNKTFEIGSSISEFDATVHSLNWKNVNGVQTNIEADISNGELKGLLEVRETIQGYRDKVNRLAAEIIRKVNDTHGEGYGLDGSTGVDFFNPLSVTTVASNLNAGTGVFSSSGIADPQEVSTDHFELTFTSSTEFTLNNLTTGASSGTHTFTSGTEISALQERGINLVISGSPESGDKFRVNTFGSAAESMGINTAVFSNSKKIAASGSGLFGDGSNARSIASLLREKVMGRTVGASSGTFTFSDFYSSLVGTVGNDTRQAIDAAALSDALKLQIENRREQSSGVSLDEEMISLIKFQQAYNASARIISVAQEMLDSLINSVR